MKPRYLVAAAVLAACTYPPVNTDKQEEIPVSTVIEVTAKKFVPEKKEQKPISKPPLSECVGIDTGNHEHDVRAKLDCIHDHG